MKKCKNCGKEFYPSQNLKNFCSFSCRKQYRKSYKRLKEQQRRASLKNVDKIHCYLSIHPNTYNENRASQKASKGNFEVEYGSQENYHIAKTCCNWETKQKGGYCITLHEPYFRFVKPCKECHILEALKFCHCEMKKAGEKTALNILENEKKEVAV